MIDNHKPRVSVEYGDYDELIEKLRGVTLMGSDIKPYENATITMETLETDELHPAQRYVLLSELRKVEQTRWRILYQTGADILALDGYLHCTYDNSDLKALEALGMSKTVGGIGVIFDTIDVLPVIVEEWVINGKIQHIIVDGMHRTFLARQMGERISVAYIRGVDKTIPYYAFANPYGWEDVEIIDELPEGYLKKFHVIAEHKKLFRNFNEEFENIGWSRPYKQK